MKITPLVGAESNPLIEVAPELSSGVLTSIEKELWSKKSINSPVFQNWLEGSKAVIDGKPIEFHLYEHAVGSDVVLMLSPVKANLSSGDSGQMVYARICKPYLLEQGFEKATDLNLHRALIEKGFDGILMPNGAMIAFDIAQLKKASVKMGQPDLFPDLFADLKTTIIRERVVSSKGKKSYHTLGNVDSTGAAIAPTVQALENFWDTFDGTLACDDAGRPLVMYHSTNSDIEKFELGCEGVNDYGLLGTVSVTRAGIFMSPDIDFSHEYLRDGAGQNILPLYLNIQNPLDLRDGISQEVESQLQYAGVSLRHIREASTYWELFDNDQDGNNELVDMLRAAGYDGAIFYEDRPSGEGEAGLTYVAFSPEQIKSAIGNRGTFNPNLADIRYRKGANGALHVDDVRGVVARLSQRWRNAPPITVVQSISDLPMAADQDGAGIYYKGHVYLVADNLINLDHAEFTLIHEVVGHHGLSGLLGDDLEKTMLRIYSDNPTIRAKANQWMIINNSDNSALATEEALSDFVASAGDVKGWKALTGTIRKGLRVLGFRLPMTNIDVDVLIKESRKWVEKAMHTTTFDSLLTRYSKVEQTLTGAFKNWFGKSKVVDDDGKPLVVYHGTGKDIVVFNTEGSSGKTNGTGAFFSSSKAKANTYTGGVNGGNLMPVYLKLENPAVFDAQGANWNRLGKKTRVELPRIVVSDEEDQQLMADLFDIVPVKGATKTIKARRSTLGRMFPDEFDYDDDAFSTDDLARWARKQGYDGVIFKNVIDHGPTGCFDTNEARMPATIYVSFNPAQIKSAIGNNGEFSRNNPDIRYSSAKKAIQPQQAAFDQWFANSHARSPDGSPLVVFHGTPNGPFSEFDTAPMFFTDNRFAARGYAEGRYARDNNETNTPIVMAVYLSMQNPKVYTEAELAELLPCDNGTGEDTVEWADFDNLAYDLEKQGFDSVIVRGTYDYMGGFKESVVRGRYDQYIVFNPCQIKSATDNIGAYSPSNPDIRYSRSGWDALQVDGIQPSP